MTPPQLSALAPVCTPVEGLNLTLLLLPRSSLKAASYTGFLVELPDGRVRHVVPALLSYLHDNPEGRDVLAVWTNNQAVQRCVLCSTPADDSADWVKTCAADRKFMAMLDALRKEVCDMALEDGHGPWQFYKCVVIGCGLRCQI